MAIAKGLTSILGIGAQASWTASGVNATDKIPFLSEGIDWSPTHVESEMLIGKKSKIGGSIVHLPVGGSIETEVHYDLKASANFLGLDMLWGMTCGDKGIYSTSNIFQPADDFKTDVPYMTVAAIVGGIVKEIPNACVNSASISGSSGGILTASFDIIGRAMALGDTSAITNVGGFDPGNTVVELQALYDSDEFDYVHSNPATFNDVSFFLGDTINVLLPGDRMTISDFTININNNLSGAEQSSIVNSGHTNAFWNIDPERNGMREVTVDFTLPRFDSDTLLAWRDNQTDLQLKLMSYKSATENIIFLFPSIRLTSVDSPVGGSGLLTQSCSAKAYIPEHSITKFVTQSGVTVNREFGIETENQRTATPW